LNLWQDIIAWFWRAAGWLTAGDNLIIVLGVLGVILLYSAFRRRR
jgi:hypothetical protein